MIVVLGATLTGMAAAARLARVGHRVVILDQAEGPHDLLPSPVDADDTTVTLPAAWRDLFRKSGRPLDAELARHRLALTPAPPAVHQLPGGDELLLPSDRAGQWHTLVDSLGAEVAATWRDLLDRLDTSWLALRPLGVEAELVTTRLDRATRHTWGGGETTILRQVSSLPPSLGEGPARARTKTLEISVEDVSAGTRLRAAHLRDAVSFDVVAELPVGHERLAVVVPWSETRFQYTVKDVARPAHGTLTIEGRNHYAGH